MRNRIFGAIGVLWGGAVVLYGLFKDTPVVENPAYRTGQITGMLMGLMMFIAGMYYLIQGGNPSLSKASQKKKKKSSKASNRIRTPELDDVDD